MLCGCVGLAFGLPNWLSFLLNLIPLLVFLTVCLIGKPASQIWTAQFLSVIYAVLMVSVFIGILIQVFDESTCRIKELLFSMFVFSAGR